MTWAENVPRGDLLPLNERPRFAGNWQYIRTELRDNHYWDEDNNKDGRHKRCDMPNLETDGDITVDANGDPDVIPTSTNGIYYVRAKTATEAPGAQNSEPFYAMNDGARLQFMQLGIRAMVSFRVSGGAITQNGGNDWDYQHNISAVSRTSQGNYLITFGAALPTANYLVLATAETVSTGDAGRRYVLVENAGKTTTTVRIKTLNRDGARRDITSLSVVVIGG